MTARQIIEARLGRSLGPIATMPRDLRCALYALALQLQRMRKGMTDTTDETIRAMSDEELFAQINGYDPYAVEFARRFLALRQERNGLRKRLDVYEGRRCGPLRITGVVEDMAGALTEPTYTQADLDAAVAAALEDAIKPLDWQPTRDAAGHDYGVMVAECPVTGGRIWAEGPENRERQEAMYRKNVRAALIESPPDARATLKTRDQAMIAKGMRRAALTALDVGFKLGANGLDYEECGALKSADAIRAEAEKLEKGDIPCT